MGTNDGVPAGWYTDPSGAPGQRWWDGSAWTDHVTPAATAPPTGPPTTPPALPEPGTAAAFAATAPVASGPGYGYGTLPPSGGPAAPVPASAAPAKKGSGVVVLAVVLAAVLLVGLLGGGAVLALRTAGSGSSGGASPVMVDGPIGGPADPVVPSTTAPTPAPDPTGRAFTDPDGVYEITIAASWKPTPAPANTMEAWRTDSDGSNVNINDGPNIDGASFDDVRRSLGKQMEAMMKGMAVDRTDVAVSTTGQQVVVLHVTNTMNPIAMRQQLYVFVTPERLVTATITAPDSAQADAAFADAEPYVLSLEVLGDL